MKAGKETVSLGMTGNSLTILKASTKRIQKCTKLSWLQELELRKFVSLVCADLVQLMLSYSWSAFSDLVVGIDHEQVIKVETMATQGSDRYAGASGVFFLLRLFLFVWTWKANFAQAVHRSTVVQRQGKKILLVWLDCSGSSSLETIPFIGFTKVNGRVVRQDGQAEEVCWGETYGQ